VILAEPEIFSHQFDIWNVWSAFSLSVKTTKEFYFSIHQSLGNLKSVSKGLNVISTIYGHT